MSRPDRSASSSNVAEIERRAGTRGDAVRLDRLGGTASTPTIQHDGEAAAREGPQESEYRGDVTGRERRERPRVGIGAGERDAGEQRLVRVLHPLRHPGRPRRVEHARHRRRLGPASVTSGSCAARRRRARSHPADAAPSPIDSTTSDAAAEPVAFVPGTDAPGCAVTITRAPVSAMASSISSGPAVATSGTTTAPSSHSATSNSTPAASAGDCTTTASPGSTPTARSRRAVVSARSTSVRQRQVDGTAVGLFEDDAVVGPLDERRPRWPRRSLRRRTSQPPATARVAPRVRSAVRCGDRPATPTCSPRRPPIQGTVLPWMRPRHQDRTPGCSTSTGRSSTPSPAPRSAREHCRCSNGSRPQEAYGAHVERRGSGYARQRAVGQSASITSWTATTTRTAATPTGATRRHTCSPGSTASCSSTIDPDDMPVRADVIAVSPYLAPNPHDRGLDRRHRPNDVKRCDRAWHRRTVQRTQGSSSWR